MKNNETKNANLNIPTSRITIGILSATGSLFVIISLIYFIFAMHQDELVTDNLQNQNKLLQKQIDNIELKDSVKIKKIIYSLVNSSNSRNLKLYVGFFADSIQRFFLLRNADKKDVYGQTQWFWKKNPSIQYNYDFKSLYISSLGNDSIKVLINGLHKKENITIVEIVTEIRFDKENKIYYIRDYFAHK